MRKWVLIFLILVGSVLFSLSLESQNRLSGTGLPMSILDMRNLSSLVVRGTFVDPESESDLVSIHVDAVYKGRCDEVVYIRRLELDYLGEFDNGDFILFLRPLGKINSLGGTYGVYPVINDEVFNIIELKKDTQSSFSVKGMLLDDFIEKYLTV